MTGLRSSAAWLALWLVACVPGAARAAVSVLPRGDVADARAIVAGEADARFVPLPGGHYIPAIDEPEVWLRIELPDPLPAGAASLTVGRMPLERLSLYRRGANAAPLWSAGFYDTAPSPNFQVTVFAWPLPADAAAGDVYYLHSFDPDPTQLRVDVRGRDEIERDDRQFVILLTFVLSVLAAMALSNAAFYVALRDPVYLHYVALMLATIAFIALSHALPYRLAALAWTSDLRSSLNVAMGALSGLFSVTFTRRFIDTQRRAPLLDRLLLVLGIGFALFALAGLWIPPAAIAPTRRTGNLMLLALSALQLVAGVVAWRRGSRAAAWFLVAWLAPIVGTVLRSAASAGYMELSPAVFNAYLIGQAVQALVLSIGLADRTLELRRQRDLAQGRHAEAEGRLREERSRRNELEHRAGTDPLTGVANRGRIEALLGAVFATARSRQESLALLVVDVDRFKQVNDGHGHPVGDLCLVMVARRILQALGPGHACGRHGGDEFLVVLPQATPDEARGLAERIRHAVAAEPIPGGVSITVSIGGTALAARDADAAALYARADQALYQSKHAGRDRVQWID